MYDCINSELILNYLKEHKLSKWKFCKKAGVRIDTLNRMLTGKDFMLTNLFKVAWAMGLEGYQLFKE